MKKSKQFKTGLTAGTFLVCLLLASGCASLSTVSDHVSPGMEVVVNYTCRLQDGTLAATTLEHTTEENRDTASTIFVPSPVSQPVIMKAGFVPECMDCNKKDRSFELVLREKIQSQLLEAHYGRTITMGIKTDEMLLDETEGQISIRRHQTRPKIKPVMLELIRSYLGREPEVGEVIQPSNQSDWPVKVLEIAEPHVTIEQLPIPGKPWITPFGPASFMDNGDEFFLSITPVVGHLVRSGGLIGRVVNVTEDAITLDYRHPFGYEELTCAVTVLGLGETVENQNAAADFK